MKQPLLLDVPNNSNDNLSEYLGQRLEELLTLRVPTPYDVSEIEESRRLLDLYVSAKIDHKDGVGITDYSKESFEELISKWHTLKPEFVAIILEDCFTNPNEVSEQFLFMRDKFFNRAESFGYCDSSRHREHLILSDEIAVVKDYCAKKRLGQIGISDKGIENLIERDVALNHRKTYIERGLPESEKKKRSEKAYVNALFRIASTYVALSDFSRQEEESGEKYRYFDRNEVEANIKEAASDAPYVKSLLSTSINQLVSRANFIRWQDTQTAPGGLLEGERLLFNSKGLVGVLTMPNNTFDRLFDYEIQLAEEGSLYKLDDMKLSFRNIFNANLAMCKNFDERVKLNKDFHSMYIGYDFGSPSKYNEQRIENYYKEAYDYFKALEKNLKEERREEENTEERIFTTSDRNDDKPKRHREPNGIQRTPTFDENKVDEFITEATHKRIALSWS